MIANRGNPSLLKTLQQSAKKVSEQNGVSETNILNKQRIDVKPVIENTHDFSSTGAYASMMKRNQPTQTFQHIRENNTSFNFESKLYERLMESVQSVKETKEYFNATSSLFTLYALGKLNEGVLSSLSREDLREIKGVVREFKGILDSY